MKAQVNVGKTPDGKDILLDLQKENLHTVILAGQTCSGKSTFDRYLYKQLIEQNTPEELAFVFFDMTRVNFVNWNTPYLYTPPIFDVDNALAMLEKLGEESMLRARGKSDTKRAIVIHIEECDMVCVDREKFERAWLNIAKNKDKNNMYIIFSTSRPSSDVFTKVILDNTDLKIVFTLASIEDSMRTLGKSLAERFTQQGQKVLLYNNKEILSQPLTKKQVGELQEFEERMTI